MLFFEAVIILFTGCNSCGIDIFAKSLRRNKADQEAVISDLRPFTLTGRLCYLFMCVERYLMDRIPTITCLRYGAVPAVDRRLLERGRQYLRASRSGVSFRV